MGSVEESVSVKPGARHQIKDAGLFTVGRERRALIVVRDPVSQLAQEALAEQPVVVRHGTHVSSKETAGESWLRAELVEVGNVDVDAGIVQGDVGDAARQLQQGTGPPGCSGWHVHLPRPLIIFRRNVAGVDPEYMRAVEGVGPYHLRQQRRLAVHQYDVIGGEGFRVREQLVVLAKLCRRHDVLDVRSVAEGVKLGEGLRHEGGPGAACLPVLADECFQATVAEDDYVDFQLQEVVQAAQVLVEGAAEGRPLPSPDVVKSCHEGSALDWKICVQMA